MPNPVETLVTPRLMIRGFRLEDVSAYSALVDENSKELLTWMPGEQFQKGQYAKKREWIQAKRGLFLLGESLDFGIFDRQNSDLLGGCSLFVFEDRFKAMEISYWLGKAYTGHRYATEAAYALLNFAFDTFGAEQVVIRVDARNRKSKGIPKRLGFQYEYGCRQFIPTWNQGKELIQKIGKVEFWILFKEEFQTMADYEPILHVNFFGEELK